MESNSEVKLYRRIKRIPQWFKDGRITSAAFKDSLGVSVSKSADRDETEIIITEEQIHSIVLKKKYTDCDIPENEELIAIGAVSKTICDEKSVQVKDDPIPENENHALLIRSDEKVELTSSQAKYLANSMKIVKKYESCNGLVW